MYSTLLEIRDEHDRLTQSQCAEDERGSGRYDAATGCDIKPGPLHPEYVNGLLAELRERLTDPTNDLTLSIRWLSPAYMTGSYDYEF